MVSATALPYAARLDGSPKRQGIRSSTTAPRGQPGDVRMVREDRVRLRFIEPGKPVQNAFVESLNGKLRDECLTLLWFRSLAHARDEISRWRHHYNAERPHSALGYRTPLEFLSPTTATAPETLAVSTLPLNTQPRPENSSEARP